MTAFLVQQPLFAFCFIVFSQLAAFSAAGPQGILNESCSVKICNDLEVRVMLLENALKTFMSAFSTQISNKQFTTLTKILQRDPAARLFLNDTATGPSETKSRAKNYTTSPQPRQSSAKKLAESDNSTKLEGITSNIGKLKTTLS